MLVVAFWELALVVLSSLAIVAVVAMRLSSDTVFGVGVTPLAWIPCSFTMELRQHDLRESGFGRFDRDFRLDKVGVIVLVSNSSSLSSSVWEQGD